MAYKAEYIWIDGTEPTAQLRSKTKILRGRRRAWPIWGFDGSSTNQAPGDNSDCVLQPVFVVPGPDPGRRRRPRDVRGAPTSTSTPHPTNTRAALRDGRREVRRPGAAVRHRAGVHVLQGRPPARLPDRAASRPRRAPTTAASAPTRSSAATSSRPTLEACLEAGLAHLRHQRRGHARPVGVPGRPARPARGRRPALDGPLAALPHRRGLRRRRHPRPQAGQGRLERRRLPTPTSRPRPCARATTPIIAACEALGAPGKLEEHVAGYGAGIEDRLTGLHETAPWTEFSYGVSDRGASVRIPWQVAHGQEGLHRGPSPQRQLRPLRRDPPDHQHGLLGRPLTGSRPEEAARRGPA